MNEIAAMSLAVVRLPLVSALLIHPTGVGGLYIK